MLRPVGTALDFEWDCFLARRNKLSVQATQKIINFIGRVLKAWWSSIASFSPLLTSSGREVNGRPIADPTATSGSTL